MIHKVSKILKLVILLSLFTVFTGGLPTPARSHGGDNTLVHACVSLRTGAVRIVGSMDTCRARERAIHWGGPPEDISARVFNSAEVTIPSGLATSTVLAFDSEEFDEGGLHDPLVDPHCLKAPIGGKYLVYFQVQWEGNSNGHRQLSLYKQTPIITLAQVLDLGVAQGNQQIISTHVKLSEGDCVFASVAQDSGTGLKVLTVNGSQSFGIVKVP